MKKALIAVIVIILLAAGYFYYSRSKSSSMSGAMTGEKVSSGMMSIKDLVAAGIPQKCAFSTTSDSGSTEGTTYVSGGNVRADSTMVADGKTTVSHMISDGTTSYMWVEGEKTGYKMTVNQEATNATAAPASGESSMKNEGDLSQQADYTCSAWVPDNSMFTPPSDVTFTDFSAMMKEAPSAAPAMQEDSSSSQSQCSYCDNLSGDQKTQCLSALNCQ